MVDVKARAAGDLGENKRTRRERSTKRDAKNLRVRLDMICAYFFLKYYDQFDGTPTGRDSVLLVLVY